jgi:NADH:ubiquinone oxidoreductase subunit 4 (subunit M)
MLSDRRHTRLIAEFGGLKAVMPRLVAAFLLITLSSIALPGMNGFIGEFLILLGGFRWHPLMASFAATGVILSAVYMLWMFQRVNYGEITNPKNRALPDLTPREWVILVPTVALAILMGVFPNIFLKPMEPSVVKTLDRINGTLTLSRIEDRGSRIEDRLGVARTTRHAPFSVNDARGSTRISERFEPSRNDPRSSVLEPRRGATR